MLVNSLLGHCARNHSLLKDKPHISSSSVLSLVDQVQIFSLGVVVKLAIDIVILLRNCSRLSLAVLGNSTQCPLHCTVVRSLLPTRSKEYLANLV